MSTRKDSPPAPPSHTQTHARAHSHIDTHTSDWHYCRDGEKVDEDAAKALNKAFFLAVERDIVKETGVSEWILMSFAGHMYLMTPS